jgi:hypothetical protein
VGGSQRRGLLAQRDDRRSDHQRENDRLRQGQLQDGGKPVRTQMRQTRLPRRPAQAINGGLLTHLTEGPASLQISGNDEWLVRAATKRHVLMIACCRRNDCRSTRPVDSQCWAVANNPIVTNRWATAAVRRRVRWDFVMDELPIADLLPYFRFLLVTDLTGFMIAPF